MPDFIRTGSTANPLNVSYALTGTAVNGIDYHSMDGIARTPPGQDRVSIEITAIEDDITEPAQWRRVSLNGHANYAIGCNHASGRSYLWIATRCVFQRQHVRLNAP